MKILFMCVANSARSQLAEGLAKKRFPHFDIQSAGSHPGKLNPYAVTAMIEVGIELAGHYSKSVEALPPDFVQNLYYVITLCAEEVCPTFLSNAKRLHWPLPDPATTALISHEEALERFRSARDAITTKLEAFAQEHSQ